MSLADETTTDEETDQRVLEFHRLVWAKEYDKADEFYENEIVTNYSLTSHPKTIIARKVLNHRTH